MYSTVTHDAIVSRARSSRSQRHVSTHTVIVRTQPVVSADRHLVRAEGSSTLGRLERFYSDAAGVFKLQLQVSVAPESATAVVVVEIASKDQNTVWLKSKHHSASDNGVHCNLKAAHYTPLYAGHGPTSGTREHLSRLLHLEVAWRFG